MKKSLWQFLKGAVIGAAGTIVGVLCVVGAAGSGYVYKVPDNEWISYGTLDKFGDNYRYILSDFKNDGYQVTSHIGETMGVGVTAVPQPVAKDWLDQKLWKIKDENSGNKYLNYTDIDLMYMAICVGDINVDGVVNSKDSYEMLRFTTYKQIELTSNLMDYILHRNRDGAIDVKPKLYLPNAPFGGTTDNKINLRNSGFLYFDSLNGDKLRSDAMRLALQRPLLMEDYAGRNLSVIKRNGCDIGVQEFNFVNPTKAIIYSYTDKDTGMVLTPSKMYYQESDDQ